MRSIRAAAHLTMQGGNCLCIAPWRIFQSPWTWPSSPSRLPLRWQLYRIVLQKG